jgi:2-methylcitrate dehydratase PrpD
VNGGHPTRELAAFVAELDAEAIPRAARDHAKLSMLDTVGCGLQGSTLEWSRMMRRLAAAEGATGESTVWGTPVTTSATQAAWLNSTAAHGFEFDDVHMDGMFHPGSVTLAAALALGERERISGSALLTAMIAGTEVGARVGRAVGTQHFRGGYHPQGTVGVFAAAATASRALGLDADRTHQAVGIAASHAAGLMGAQRGAMVKRLHSGHAAQSGVLAALLAGDGFTGTADVLETPYGGFCATMGGGDVHLERLAEGLGSNWETLAVAFKPYPSCAAAQASIEAARVLREANALDGDDVDLVVVTTSEHVRVHSGWTYSPEGVTAAQMSIGYGIARMLAEGTVDARHFTDEAIAEPQIVSLAQRVSVIGDPAIDALGPQRRYVATVEISTRDGRRLRHRIDDRPGNASNPMTEEELHRKFAGLAAPVLGEQQAAEVSAAIGGIEGAASVAALGSKLRVPPPNDLGLTA